MIKRFFPKNVEDFVNENGLGKSVGIRFRISAFSKRLLFPYLLVKKSVLFRVLYDNGLLRQIFALLILFVSYKLWRHFCWKVRTFISLFLSDFMCKARLVSLRYVSLHVWFEFDNLFFTNIACFQFRRIS